MSKPTKADLRAKCNQLERALAVAQLNGLSVPGTLGFAFGDRQWCNLTPWGAKEPWVTGRLYLATNGTGTAGPTLVAVASMGLNDELIVVRAAREKP